tara:strand:- start:3591 stop:6071 length:2481 start_codon:yes stop_codon:yes gene_type:complete
MHSDKKIDGSSSSETFIVAYDDSESAMDIRDSDGWNANQITAFDSDLPVFYVGDGNLRIGDGEFDDAINNKWFGYINYRLFNGLNADSTALAWTQANQAIQSPTVGNCLISTPFAGSDSDGVNSSASEYIGNVADASGEDVADVQSVNLRVGLQYNELLPNAHGDWVGTYVGLTTETTYYPLIAGVNVKATSSATQPKSTVKDTGQEFSINEEQSFVMGFYITASEYADFKRVNIVCHTTDSDGGDNVAAKYRFTKEELVPDAWNFLVCSVNNSTGGEYTFGDTLTRWVLIAVDADGSSASPTFWLSGPVLAKNSSVDGFQPGIYEFYHSYLYDEEKQESLPFKFTDTGSGNVNKLNIAGDSVLLNFDSYINPYNSAGSPVYTLSKRIVGSRLYYKLEENDDFYLIGELDFIEKGFKWFPEGDTLAYSMANVTGDGTPTGETFYKTCVIVKGITPLSANFIDTFKTVNGYSGSVKSIEAKFKTAVVQGRRTYIGNIRQDGKNYPDRIIKSQINKFDVFPDKIGAIDVVVNDGESIVKLETFADRILQFKEKTLYIINVAETVDFLEETVEGKGVAFDYHVVKTDFGIAWFNKLGAYLYTGKEVINLLEKQGRRLLSESYWEAFVTDAEDGGADDLDMSSAHIGHIPQSKQILIRNENTDVLVYDFVIQAWTRSGGTAYGVGGVGVTNLVNNSNRELFYLTNNDADVMTWNTSPPSTGIVKYVTKDIDFGQPSVRKKVYKVYISYTSDSGSVPTLRYGVNGDTTPTNALTAVTAFANSQPEWTQAEYKFGSDANNCYSIQLLFGESSVGGGFKINDITIVYRMKSIK